ncbi:dTMP kinase [Candidatus Microgenomates bacterium]|nr:dTMP kinase [Candidatus Microgenomates bacterium]
MSKGELLVIDGIDGSGKTTQIELLKKYLFSKNIPFEVISFPQYGKNEYADRIADYLSGKFGEISDIDPYEMAKLYASDRKTIRDSIFGWLKEGKLVIANRYIASSKAHLGANMNEEKREKFMEWIDQLEYQTNGMPKPDLTILLKVDPKVGQENALKDHKVDIHEKSLEHEQKAAKIYFELSEIEENWQVIDCMRNGGMRTPQDIHNEIINRLYPITLV